MRAVLTAFLLALIACAGAHAAEPIALEAGDGRFEYQDPAE